MTSTLASLFRGVFTHPRTRRTYAYAATCHTAVNPRGHQAMHIQGQICCDDLASDFVLRAHADPGHSVHGRAASVVLDCVALACERDAAARAARAQRAAPVVAGPAPAATGRA